MASLVNLPEDISTQIAIHRGIIKARWLLIVGLGFVGILLKVAGRNESTTECEVRPPASRGSCRGDDSSFPPWLSRDNDRRDDRFAPVGRGCWGGPT